MNRLILVGNGFDLAHGMKTSYADFIKWYIKKRILKGAGSDGLMSITLPQGYMDRHNINEVMINHWVNDCYNAGFDLSKLGTPRVDVYGSGRMVYPFIFTVDSNLMQRLIDHCANYKWVDVEAIFYETLLSIVSRSTVSKPTIEKRLSELNACMHTLIMELQNYFNSLPSVQPIYQYETLITSVIKEEDLESIQNKFDYADAVDKIPRSTQILNFNYTSTIEQYIPRSRHLINVNYIHGELNDANNPVIFGFGDELDEQYSVLERAGKGVFEYIKSFWYLRTSHYQDLVRFIDYEHYQVFILGHSCGLSDRTMLHMIFEHPNCKSIKVFYHEHNGKNNYTETTFEIARHFKNKATMRKRIVSMDKCSPMPQTT